MSAGEAAAMADSGRTGGPPARDLRYGTQCGGYSDCRSRGRPLGPSERDAARPPSLVSILRTETSAGKGLIPGFLNGGPGLYHLLKLKSNTG